MLAAGAVGEALESWSSRGKTDSVVVTIPGDLYFGRDGMDRSHMAQTSVPSQLAFDQSNRIAGQEASEFIHVGVST